MFENSKRIFPPGVWTLTVADWGGGVSAAITEIVKRFSTCKQRCIKYLTFTFTFNG